MGEKKTVASLSFRPTELYPAVEAVCAGTRYGDGTAPPDDAGQAAVPESEASYVDSKGASERREVGERYSEDAGARLGNPLNAKSRGGESQTPENASSCNHLASSVRDGPR